MRIKVNEVLTKTLKHKKYILEGTKGTVVHILDDDFWLIEFMQCEWYVHKDDLMIVDK